MRTNIETAPFLSVDQAEQQAVEGGIVAFEYLLVSTILALGLIVGFSSMATSSAYTRQPLQTATRA